MLWGDLQQFSRRPEDQAIPVPASGEVAEYLTAAVPEVLEHPEDGVPPQAAKAGHPHGYAAPGQALGQDVPLGGDGLLTVHPGGGGVQQQVHRKAGAGGVRLPDKDPPVGQRRRPPDTGGVQLSAPGGLLLRLAVDPDTVLNLLRQPPDSVLVEGSVR